MCWNNINWCIELDVLAFVHTAFVYNFHIFMCIYLHKYKFHCWISLGTTDCTFTWGQVIVLLDAVCIHIRMLYTFIHSAQSSVTKADSSVLKFWLLLGQQSFCSVKKDLTILGLCYNLRFVKLILFSLCKGDDNGLRNV